MRPRIQQFLPISIAICVIFTIFNTGKPEAKSVDMDSRDGGIARHIAPDNAIFRFYYAHSLEKTGKIDEAITSYITSAATFSAANPV